MIRLLMLAAVLVLAGPLTPAWATVVLDQYHPWYRVGTALTLGGESEQMLAQTFLAGRSGRLHRLSLMWNCAPASPGLLTLELQGTDAEGRPDGHVLAAVAQASAAYADSDYRLREIPFDGPAIVEGTRYAIVVRAERDSLCSLPGVGAPFVGYPRGQAWFDARPNPPGWVALSAAGEDLLFYVHLEVAEPTGPTWCAFDDASGLPNDWLPNDVPICGCLSEPSLRVNRCWFAFPDFVAWRELRWGGNAGSAIWGITPIAPELGPMSIVERGIDATLKVDPVRIPGQLPAGIPAQFAVGARGTAKRSLVDMTIRRAGSEAPIRVRFETRIDIPDPTP